MQFLQGFRMVTDQDNLQLQLNIARTDEWLQSDVLHLRWWLMLLLFIITAFLWWKVLDKSRLPEYLLFSFLVVIFILSLDELGEEMTLWYYTTDLVRGFPRSLQLTSHAFHWPICFCIGFSENGKGF